MSSRGKKNGGVDVSHLLFVDDTLIFFRASKDEVMHVV